MVDIRVRLWVYSISYSYPLSLFRFIFPLSYEMLEEEEDTDPVPQNTIPVQDRSLQKRRRSKSIHSDPSAVQSIKSISLSSSNPPVVVREDLSLLAHQAVEKSKNAIYMKRKLVNTVKFYQAESYIPIGQKTNGRNKINRRNFHFEETSSTTSMICKFFKYY